MSSRSSHAGPDPSTPAVNKPARAKDERPLLERDRFGLCITAIVKNEAHYIEEWLCYHLALGVDHFFIFDNNSEDGLATVLKPYVNHGLVTLLHWPLPGGQVDAYRLALRFFGSVTEWMAFIDIDEFIVPKNADDIPAFLARFPEADQILIPWRVFGFSGHRTRPSGLVIENFTLAEAFSQGDRPRLQTKGIVRSRAAISVGPHNATTVSKATVNEHGERIPEKHVIEAASFDHIQINHYYSKSQEEFEAKIQRGRVSGGAHYNADAHDNDKYTSPDESALRFVERTKTTLAKMQRLALDPFRYGSELRLPDFPRRDPFDWAAKVALSNFLADVPTVEHEAILAFTNLGKRHAMVARTTDHDRVLTLGAAERSIHIQDLIRRVGGRVSWSFAGGASDAIEFERCALAVKSESVALLTQGDKPGIRFRCLNGELARCFMLVIALRAADATEFRLSLRLADDSEPIAPRRLSLPRDGDHVAIVELNDGPRCGKAIELRFMGRPPAVSFYDLMLVEYG